jgi:ubiquinone/menaquinone biosynthesis C-methylase UbiE
MPESDKSYVTPQAFSVKRAQVEFHNFASLGEPARVMRVYREANIRRAGLLRKYMEFVGPLTPFLEIGANAGHSSYMLANEFGAEGFALDISADALRHGVALQEEWDLERAPKRIAGDAVHLPFRDNSLRFVMTHQTLSQFMDLDAVFAEVRRVLAPGGVFFFSEEPMRRVLTFRLYRCPYPEQMKPWERKLHEWGLLGYLVRDVIGAHQEENFGIRQNHRMYLKDWHELSKRHFAAQQFDLFVPERGWGERWMKQLAVRLDPCKSVWRAARLLGGTLAGFCRKAGDPVIPEFSSKHYEDLLQCPDCQGGLHRTEIDVLVCTSCGYTATNEGQVHNLLPSAERKELYPGDREDVADFSLPGHARHLGEGWYELEGGYGNRYRWIGSRATATLTRVRPGPLRLRIRGYAQDQQFREHNPHLEIRVNGSTAGKWTLDRVGLFVLEADVPDAAQYDIEILSAPEWTAPGDPRRITLNLSMLRLIPRD